ncbi:MAG: trehalose-6-phosphate synthase [Candidatus Acidiferrales bacterium]
MRISLRWRLVSALILGITLVTFFVARAQVRAEKRALREDLQRRAEILAESLQEIVEPLLARGGAHNQLQRIVERFGNRQRLAGVAIYNDKGEILAESSNLILRFDPPPVSMAHITGHDQGFAEFQSLGGTTMHVYYLPLYRESKMVGALAIFHDASYIEAQSARIWRETLWHVIIQVLLIVSITVLIIRWTIVMPIARTAKWLKDLRIGKVAPRPKIPDDDFFKPFSEEVVNLARSLAEARASAEEEARLRQTGESLWTAERLRVGMQSKLNGRPLFVVSNREPYEHVSRGKETQVVVPASGLVTALEPILRACDGTWIAYGSGDRDREAVDEHDRVRVPPDHPQYTLRRVWLSEKALEGYYFGFANEGLWPLCHIAHTRPIFRADDWEQYQEANSRFCEALLEEMEGAQEPIVLIQDYHFALLPRYIKERRPDARVAIFWHIPWPNPEAFGICPWQREVLDGILGADLVSFHVQAHCNNFLETIDRALESRIDWDRFAVNRRDHMTVVRPHPISVAYPESAGEVPNESLSVRERGELSKKLGVEAEFLGIGVDRLDYTKGIGERFRGVERFLEKNQSYRGHFTFVQVGAPSRTRIKRYQEFLREVQDEADRINARFQTKRWKPILFLNKHHSHQEIEPLYKAASVCLVTSLHDGMNLVAKEFVAARDDDDGVLILSRFTGAARELRDALIVNPYDVEQVADAIQLALEMPLEERMVRMQQMRRVVKEHNVYRWAAELLLELAEIRLEEPQPVPER